MEAKIRFCKIKFIYIDTPKWLLFVWIFGYSIAQSNIYPSPFYICFVNTYRITNKVNRMANNMQALQITTNTQVTNKIDGICFEFCKG